MSATEELSRAQEAVTQLRLAAHDLVRTIAASLAKEQPSLSLKTDVEERHRHALSLLKSLQQSFERLTAQQVKFVSSRTILESAGPSLELSERSLDVLTLRKGATKRPRETPDPIVECNSAELEAWMTQNAAHFAPLQVQLRWVDDEDEGRQIVALTASRKHFFALITLCAPIHARNSTPLHIARVHITTPAEAVANVTESRVELWQRVSHAAMREVQRAEAEGREPLSSLLEWLRDAR